MISYPSFRLLVDFLKPYPRLFLGLGGIQWACVLVLLYYSRDIARWLRPMRPRQRLRREDSRHHPGYGWKSGALAPR